MTERSIPVVYPINVRYGQKQTETKKKQEKTAKKPVMDKRGFKSAPNPMGQVHKNKTIISGVYKTRKLTTGFEACHIWYDTTRAPTLFSYIPNIVYLPQMISKLSDEILKNAFFPPLLKDSTKFTYHLKGRRNQKMLDIIDGCWDGLAEDEEEKYGPKGIRPPYLFRNSNRFFLGNVRTENGVKNILDFIKECKEKLTSEEKKKGMQKEIEEFGKKLEEQIKEEELERKAIEEEKKTKLNGKPMKQKKKQEKGAKKLQRKIFISLN